jgi:hypothetical protein
MSCAARSAVCLHRPVIHAPTDLLGDGGGNLVSSV